MDDLCESIALGILSISIYTLWWCIRYPMEYTTLIALAVASLIVTFLIYLVRRY